MSVRTRIRRYLKATGWAQKLLAEVCRLERSGLTHVLKGNRPLSVEQALKLEKGTRAALAAGLTNVPPLLARDLLSPKDAALLPPVAA